MNKIVNLGLSVTEWIDSLINGITMYRLLLYYLIAILLTAVVLGEVHIFGYSPVAILLSSCYVITVCWVVNRVFAYVYGVPHNPESSLITGLIIACLITPLSSTQNLLFMSAASGLAMASKYLLTWRRKHLFNPAAVAFVLTALGAGDSASWWVGTSYLAPVVILGGILIVRKIHRGAMVAMFIGVSLAATAVLTLLSGGDVAMTLQRSVLDSSLLFLGFVMLTEPLTSPPSRPGQLWYAGIVGVIMQTQVHVGSFYSSPEIALVMGNGFAYVVSPKVKMLLKPKRLASWGGSTKDFIFDRGTFAFKPGQYMEFTLPHERMDSRGWRRYFTIASSPTESNLRIGVRFYKRSSSFKRALAHVSGGSVIAAGNLGGDFVMPNDVRKKLAFLAGGIGVTPFRSMIKYVTDTGEKRDISMIYSDRTVSDFAYGDVFSAAAQTGKIRVAYTVTDASAGVPDNFQHGVITEAMIRQNMPDFAERIFYISGPHVMVSDMEKLLISMGLSRRQIKVDFFPGYA